MNITGFLKSTHKTFKCRLMYKKKGFAMATMNNSNNGMHLTPVQFQRSPQVKSPNSNIANCQTRLDIIIKTIQDDYAKWQSLQAQGLNLCNGIEVIKTKMLQSVEGDFTATSGNNLYSNDLHKYSDKLYILTTILESIHKNAKDALRQLKSLSKLPGSCNETFYRTWRLEQFKEFLTELADRYEKEVFVKRWIAQNVPHSLSRIDLIHHVCAWEYPQYTDSHMDLMFALLKEEIAGKKV